MKGWSGGCLWIRCLLVFPALLGSQENRSVWASRYRRRRDTQTDERTKRRPAAAVVMIRLQEEYLQSDRRERGKSGLESRGKKEAETRGSGGVSGSCCVCVLRADDR